MCACVCAALSAKRMRLVPAGHRGRADGLGEDAAGAQMRGRFQRALGRAEQHRDDGRVATRGKADVAQAGGEAARVLF